MMISRKHSVSLRVRGAVAIVFAIAVFMLPAATLGLLFIFVSYALVDAIILAMLASWAFTSGIRNWRWLGLEAAASLAFAIGAFVWVPTLAIGLIYLIAIWALVTGILEIAAGLDMHEPALRNPFVIGGALSCTVGIALVAFAHLDRSTISWLLAAYAIAAGVTLIAAASRTRHHAGSRHA